jgi:hypothetical protein
MVADTLSRPPGPPARRPPLAATSVKVPSGSQVAVLQGDKQKSSDLHFMAWQPARGRGGGEEGQPAVQRVTWHYQATCATVFHAIHSVAHPGIHAKRMVTARLVWKGVGKDVAAMCPDCQQCQRSKVHKQPAAPLHAIPVLSHKFSQVRMDLDTWSEVGPSDRISIFRYSDSYRTK